MTRYVVLRQDESGYWREAGPHTDAVSAEAAVRKAVTDKGGTFVAVPVRSFAPITVEVETKRTLKVVTA